MSKVLLGGVTLRSLLPPGSRRPRLPDSIAPSPGEISTLLDVYGITDPEQREAYLKLAAEAAMTGWWTGYPDILGQGAYVDLETEASEIRNYEPMMIPGLLQTPDYVRATTRRLITDDEQEVARRVEARAVRRQTLERPDPLKLHAILDEAALRKVPAEVAEGQFRYLLDVRQRGHVTIQVAPDEAGPHAGLHGAFVLMGFAHDPTLVYLEQSLGGLFLEEEHEIAHYERVFASIRGIAISTDDTVAFLDESLNKSR